uniref:Uncharacterized protein n=1 Tax=Anguilla anguilla TaxID=7936 RepID=A0A0E9Q1F5_ANGAN
MTTFLLFSFCCLLQPLLLITHLIALISIITYSDLPISTFVQMSKNQGLC